MKKAEKREKKQLKADNAEIEKDAKEGKERVEAHAFNVGAPRRADRHGLRGAGTQQPLRRVGELEHGEVADRVARLHAREQLLDRRSRDRSRREAVPQAQAAERARAVREERRLPTPDRAPAPAA